MIEVILIMLTCCAGGDDTTQADATAEQKQTARATTVIVKEQVIVQEQRVDADSPATTADESLSATVIYEDDLSSAPSAAVQAAVDQIKSQSSGYWLGVSCANLPELVKKQMNIEGGVVVGCVADGSPAYQVKLKKDDIICKLDRTTIQDVDGLVQVVQSCGSKEVTIELLRNGQPTELKITAERRPQPQVAMVMVGPDGKGLCEQSEALLRSMSSDDPQAMSILVIRPGLVMPKSQISNPMFQPQKVQLEVVSDLNPNLATDDQVVWTQAIDSRSSLPTFPSTVLYAAEGVRSLQQGTIHLNDRQIQLFPDVSNNKIAVRVGSVDRESQSFQFGENRPRVRVIRLMDNASEQHSELGEYRVEVQTANAGNIFEMKAQAERMEQQLQAMNEQLKNLHAQLDAMEQEEQKR